MAASDNPNKQKDNGEQLVFSMKIELTPLRKRLLVLPNVPEETRKRAVHLTVEIEQTQLAYLAALQDHGESIQRKDPQDIGVAKFMYQLAEVPYGQISKLIDSVWHDVMDNDPKAGLDLMDEYAGLAAARIALLDAARRAELLAGG